ncbi:protein-L-isoaspartate(D-aspartate) O-methyltransferase [Streptomyces sp. H10-C2]|uniref:protein-L-isoaspartate O-methyltransferase family protein n=1 Tax=unclassified Streptomyces TaxID=2593676 RepID=UPI0024BA1BF5|nr:MULTISPECIES: protein-L-isoaspartate(D-aspartate) O-methyltransferase [unclassified Streptomyces]MDJ0346613.1 protein-L-isoaspartate(D-aspartate) O-methyltransferase [Streptomyces sp. PH10-H1]MDJ0375014.1 protein-L-isoaspartate(D-aspartate) O-methyltransferase [Streptomyces sp. H10-C2]
MDWKPRASALADAVVHPASRWHGPLSATPRHLFVPRWWRRLPESGWTLREGTADPSRWATAAYSDRTLVTRVGSLHADHAADQDHPEGLPTSSSTLPTLMVAMYRHAMIVEGADVLCVTGSGYGTALLARRLGDRAVTSMDIDPYLVDAARERLDLIGVHSGVYIADITGPLPGTFDRIVSTVGLPGIPPGWLTGLRDGGRFVTNLAGTGLVIAADKTADGGARGHVTWERAGFMATRTGQDYPQPPTTRHAWTDDADDVATGRYPVIQVAETWELMTSLAVAVPGVQHGYNEDDGVRTAVMVHADGSWARATGRRGDRPTVHQAGPRRLWDILDAIRHDWLTDGSLPVYGATAMVDPDGTLRLTRGSWQTIIPAAVSSVEPASSSPTT